MSPDLRPVPGAPRQPEPPETAVLQLGGEFATAALSPDEFEAHYRARRLIRARMDGKRVWVNPRAVRMVEFPR